MIPLILLSLALLVAAATYAAARLTRKELPPALKRSIQREWKKLLDDPSPVARILRADALLGQALCSIVGGSGTTNDRLKRCRTRFRSVKHLFTARALRNRLAHETEVKASDKQLIAALEAYHQALQDLGV